MLFLFLNKSLDLGWVRTVGKESFCKEFSLSNFVAIILHFVLPLIPLFDPPPHPPKKKKKKNWHEHYCQYFFGLPRRYQKNWLCELFWIKQVAYYGQYETGEIKLAFMFTMSVLGASEFLEVNFQAKHCEISSLCS